VTGGSGKLGRTVDSIEFTGTGVVQADACWVSTPNGSSFNTNHTRTPAFSSRETTASKMGLD
jgi:hypothetical protein